MFSKRNYFFIILIIWSGFASAQIREVINSSGDGGGNTLDGTVVATDAAGNIYVGGLNTDNVFRAVSSTYCATTGVSCGWVEIIDGTGDGSAILDRTSALATDAAGNLYVVGQTSDNVFRINNPDSCSTGGTPCSIEEIINSSGDGLGNILDNPVAIQIDGAGNVYIAGASSNNVLRIAASTTCDTTSIGDPCIITEIIDVNGDGSNVINQPVGLAIDGDDSVYVTTQNSDNAFKIATPGVCTTTLGNCTITEIIDDSTLTTQAFGRGIIADSQGNIFVTQMGFFNNPGIYKINTPGTCSTGGTSCTITQIYAGTLPQQAGNMAVDELDNIYFVGGNGDNAYRIDKPESCSISGTPCIITEIIDATGDGNAATLNGPGSITVANGVDVYVAGGGSDNVFRVSNVADSSDVIFRNGYD